MKSLLLLLILLSLLLAVEPNALNGFRAGLKSFLGEGDREFVKLVCMTLAFFVVGWVLFWIDNFKGRKK